MKRVITILCAIPLVILMTSVSCSKDNPGGGGSYPSGGDNGESKTLVFTPIEKLNSGDVVAGSHAGLTKRSTLSPIAGTYIQLAESVTMRDNPVYARFSKTSNGDYLLFYHNKDGSWAGNACDYMRSPDLINWTWEKQLFSVYSITDCTGKANKRGFAGAHPLLLKDGRLMCVASTRAVSDFRERIADNGLSIVFSNDGGHNWTTPQTIFVGTNWEPMPIQLTSGRIIIYYTDSQKFFGSNAYDDGSEVISTGSSYIYSDDGGETWLPSGDQTSFSSHLRAFAQIRCMDGDTPVLTDQMPAVLQIAGKNKLAAAAESFIGKADYTSYISLAWSDDNGDWGTPDALGILPADRINKFCLGSAPYLAQFPSGESFLSYNRSSVFYMRQGDENCRNFGAETKVFPQTAATGKGFWGSLYCIDSHRMIAGVGGSGNILQIGQFYLNHAITAANHSVSVDGGNSDWKTSDEALYICSLGDTKATVRCSQDSNNIYFLFEVTDKDISKDDYVQLFLSDPTKDKLSANAIRIKASYSGLKNSGPYAGGWLEQDMGVKVSSAYDGTPANNADEDHGYLVEISIPRSSLHISGGQLLANFVLFDIKNGGEDAIVPTGDLSTGSWIPINGL